MKKYILGVLVGAIVFTGTSVLAAPNGEPFQVLWSAVEDLQAQIDELWVAINNIELIPGPPGPQGPPGEDFTVPSPTTVIFAESKPEPFNSDWIKIPKEYNTLTVTFEITGSIADYAIHFTNDPNNSDFVEQKRVNCNNSSECPPVTIPVLGAYYRISTGTGNGAVTSKGFLIWN